MKARTAIWLMIGLLVLTSLACERAGDILTPAEATARAAAEDQGGYESSGSATDSEFAAGDTATLTGRSFLVNLYSEPGGKISAGQERGATVTVLETTMYKDKVWYKIEAAAGEGWVPNDGLEPMEDEATIDGPQPGDEVYLAGKSYLVNFLDKPGGMIIAGQERGAAITILELAQVDGAIWYKISAPAGEGWVTFENVTTEAP